MVISPLIRDLCNRHGLISDLDLSEYDADRSSDAGSARLLNNGFLAALAGTGHPMYDAAANHLRQHLGSPAWSQWSKFYLNAIAEIEAELAELCQQDPAWSRGAKQAETLVSAGGDERSVAEAFWAVFFPEAKGILGRETETVDLLRERRTIQIDSLNQTPVQDPLRQILFTSNVLLTTPLDGADLSGFDAEFRQRLAEVAREPQRYWYDHPIPIGVAPEQNEILYGLRHLDEAVAAERERNPQFAGKLVCVLSVSVTHDGLHELAAGYLRQVLAAEAPLRNLEIYAFTEAETGALIEQAVLPASARCHPETASASSLKVFGVDGHYGRHYSFLKAIAAFWQVLIDPEIKATFKIDLDQVFPQKELAAQTGTSAFEHLQTPLWGATGRDSRGRSVELGMIAGALVNQRDIDQGLFTPDVRFPTAPLQPDQYVFFSTLPQAVSTEAEMMTRYDMGHVPDGKDSCLERIHVTGGTNGILVDSLRRFRPFTPSFIARAEDQAYILSILDQPERLAYCHASGLFMRHDKEGFAQEAIAMARTGKLVGDYLRILKFSAYARVLSPGVDDIKDLFDPFTGSFISRLPVTVTMLRFALNTATLFRDGRDDEAVELMSTAIPQLEEALRFVQGEPSDLEDTFEREKEGWGIFYDALQGIEDAMDAKEGWANDLSSSVRDYVSGCRVS